MARVALRRELEAEQEALNEYLRTNRRLAQGYKQDVAAINAGTPYAVQDPKTKKYYYATGVKDNGDLQLSMQKQTAGGMLGGASYMTPVEAGGRVVTAGSEPQYIANLQKQQAALPKTIFGTVQGDDGERLGYIPNPKIAEYEQQLAEARRIQQELGQQPAGRAYLASPTPVKGVFSTGKLFDVSSDGSIAPVDPGSAKLYPLLQQPQWAARPDQTSGVTIAGLKSTQGGSGLLQEAMGGDILARRNFGK